MNIIMIILIAGGLYVAYRLYQQHQSSSDSGIGVDLGGGSGVHVGGINVNVPGVHVGIPALDVNVPFANVPGGSTSINRNTGSGNVVQRNVQHGPGYHVNTNRAVILS